MTPNDFQKKYFNPDGSLNGLATVEIDKMYSPGLGITPVKIYTYNPNYTITEACAQDLANILGVDMGLSVVIQFPNGPGGNFFDSGMCAFFSMKGFSFNAGFYVSEFTHGVDPSQVVDQIRANP